MEIKTIGDFRKAIRHGPYAWPGGYPVYFVMSDGESMSFKAAKENKRELLQAFLDHREGYATDWLPIALEINWEDSDLICCQTNRLIESAYDND